MERFDVAIIGAGIFGLSAAWALRKRGLTVAIHDKSGIGKGASGGLIGALSPHMPEKWNPKKEYQLEALLGAEAFWREIEAISSRSSGYAKAGRLMPLMTERARDMALERAQNAVSLWQGKAEWNVIDHADHCTDAAFGWVHETLSAKLTPRLALAALTEALCKMDADFFLSKETRATAPPVAKHVVYAVGSDTGSLLPDFASGFWSAVKGQSALLSADLPAEMPVVFDRGTYVVRQGQGQVAVGSTSETKWDDPIATDDLLDAVIETAIEIVPKLAGAEVIERWAGLRPRARLPDPAIGELPDRPNHWVMSGGYKIGIGLAPLLGEALAAMICGEAHGLPESFTLTHQLSR